MRAVVCTKYGPPDVLELQEVETPVPGDNEVLDKSLRHIRILRGCENAVF